MILLGVFDFAACLAVCFSPVSHLPFSSGSQAHLRLSSTLMIAALACCLLLAWNELAARSRARVD